MREPPTSGESENAPSAFRLQHSSEKPHFIYDEAHKIGIIDASQHSDMVHFCMMRDAFHGVTAPRGTVIGRLMEGKVGNDNPFDGRSMGDKYAAYLREVPHVTQATIEAMAGVHHPSYRRSAYYRGREIMQCHLSAFRKWLDNN